MAAMDFWIKITPVGTLLYCETDIARSVAFEISRDDGYPARVSNSGCGNPVLGTSIADLERWGYGVQTSQCAS
jgi:hypothetical protein